ncbi:uncharacterized protein FTJAE_9509 [Fusarium tjaetaba]|uniref:Uncharacterized protein n=1 Tax=Fusarium tjaetaba TaxID=1567544 RepID=A0A8H5R545_9HYPO|nr:uncharacterized protein FTJAE_9509 [Fusarium tjaetaba]KAF5626729.1 hypothetical protein FTJAE_9509 [Fusarium tjaetaba]
MSRRHSPLQGERHFCEYRCIICNSVLETCRSMRPEIVYALADNCYNCIYETSYSLATYDEASSQEFLQTMLRVAQVQIANEIAEASDQLAYSSPWSPTTTDAVLEPDDETETQPSLYDETPEERDERFRNLRAVQDLPAHHFYSPELVLSEQDEVQLEPSLLGASEIEAYVNVYEFDASFGEASGLNAPEGDARPAPAPHQSRNEQEEGLDIMI